ncbi:MAG: mechanosensitive ion channel [Deltaproteobacteria bacterium]|nr:mechanosensitive ion channel [Deltaproteobacteria bacterium]
MGSLAIIVVWVALDWLIRSAFARSVQALPNVPRSRLQIVEQAIRLALLGLVIFSFCDLLGYAPQDLWTVFSTILGLIAVALFAFWSILSSFTCGLMLAVSRPFNVGDTIEVFDPSATDKPGTRGTVVEMSALFTVLQDIAHPEQRMHLPHNQVLQRGIRVFPRAPQS